MADKVTIYNLALAHLGEDAAVISPSETSEEAKACETFYPSAKAKLLELHDWSFASRTEALAELTLANTLGWQGGYALPSGCLRIQYVRASEFQHARYLPVETDWPYEVRVSGTTKILYTDCPAPIAGFIGDTDEAMFSPSFTDALAWLLASYVAGERIKGSEGASFAQNCEQQYQRALSLAKDLDSDMTNLKTNFVPDWIKVR